MATTVAAWQALYGVAAEPTAGMPHPGHNALPTAQIELSISCHNLLDLDIVTKSDPQVIVYMRDPWQPKFFEVARTEIISDSLNPNFVRKIPLNYNFETVQTLKFEVWDIDITRKEFLGQLEVTLAEIVAYKGRQYTKQLLSGQRNRNCGTISIVVEEVSTNKQIITLGFKAYDLRKRNWFVNNDPFLTLWRSNEDNTYTVVHKTETCRSTQRPTFKPFSVRVRTLCNGDLDRSIRVDCMDHRVDGDHKLIGSFFTTCNRLANGTVDENKYELTKPNSRKDPTAVRGVVELVQVALVEEPTFLDYIKGGTEMHFAVAVDFTASNGDPADPRSLHYLDPSGRKPTSYEVALRAVGEIIAQYDSHGMFPGYGFGARLPPTMEVSHHFPLNNNPSHPYCAGVDEIVHWYKERLKSIGRSLPSLRDRSFVIVIVSFPLPSSPLWADQFRSGDHFGREHRAPAPKRSQLLRSINYH